MRFLALSLFGVYQFGNSASVGVVLDPAQNGGSRTNTRGGHGLATINEDVSEADVIDPEFADYLARVAHQEKLLNFKTDMEHLDLPREYIETCFFAMGMDKDKVSHLLTIHGVEPEWEIAEKLTLEKKLMKLSENSRAIENDQFGPCLSAMVAQYMHAELMAALEARRIRLKQHMEWLNVPREYIRVCFATIMGDYEAKSLMTIPAVPPSSAKWTFEDNLWSLRFWWTDAEVIPCFNAIEAAHQKVKAADVIARIVRKFMSAQHVAKVQAGVLPTAH